MSNITLATLREYVARELGLWKEYATTSAGSTSLDTLVSSQIADYDDESLREHFVLITDSTDTSLEGNVRRIKLNQSPSGTVNVYRPFGTQVPSASTFELMKHDPDEITKFINRTIRDSYPYLCKLIVDTSLVSGSIIPNGHFDDWTVATYPDYWRNSVTTASKSTTIWGGTSSLYSCQLGTAAGYLYLSSDNYPALMKTQAGSISVYCWVKTAAASNAYMTVVGTNVAGTATTTTSVNKSTTTVTQYHTGAGEWELLAVENASIPDNLAEVQIRLYIATTTAAQFDNCFASTGETEYLMPSSLDEVLHIFECNSANDQAISGRVRQDFYIIDKSGTKYLMIPNAGSGKHLEVLGYNIYSELSADTSTIDLTSSWERAIIAGSVGKILRSIATTISSKDSEDIKKSSDSYLREWENLKKVAKRFGIPTTLNKWGLR